MNEQTKKIIKDELEKLPIERQTLINSFDWVDISKKIGAKYSFTDDQINKLQIETLLVLTEMEYLSDLGVNLENSLVTTKNQAEGAARELSEQIFKPIAQKIESSVKNQIISDTPTWQQTINFIVSGGDYSVFLDN